MQPAANSGITAIDVAQTVIALVALVIAIISLVWTWLASRRGMRPAITAHLDILRASRSFHFRLVNVGMGPAKILGFRMTRDGNDALVVNSSGQKNPFAEFMPGFEPGAQFGQLDVGSILPAGGAATVLKGTIAEDGKNANGSPLTMDSLCLRLKAYVVEIEYESFNREHHSYSRHLIQQSDL